MKSHLLLLVVLTFLISAYSTQAFDALIHEFPVQYEVVTIENPETEQLILGELSDAPEMYEIVSENPFTLTVEIRAIPNLTPNVPPQFQGIIIKQKEVRGVEEIARLNAVGSAWSVVIDKATGLKYQAGPYFSEQVEAGTYRIEVSSPDNNGKYMLMVGAIADEQGYSASLSDIATVYEFYDISSLRMFSSPYVHYPVGILILILLLGGTYAWQRKQKHHA